MPCGVGVPLDAFLFLVEEVDIEVTRLKFDAPVLKRRQIGLTCPLAQEIEN
jgi:hypothetical protein